MHQGMTQEELAFKLDVSRQTISKWEMDAAFPEMEKAIALCEIFSCSLDELLRQDLWLDESSFSEMKVVTLDPIKYVMYTVVSEYPEDNALAYVGEWAKTNKIENADIIGWDFPKITQEQVNVYHMHGYTAACILPNDFVNNQETLKIINQGKKDYAKITIKDPFRDPFATIPNAYKALMKFIKVNNLSSRQPQDCIPCFEREYTNADGTFMDIYIAIEK